MSYHKNENTYLNSNEKKTQRCPDSVLLKSPFDNNTKINVDVVNKREHVHMSEKERNVSDLRRKTFSFETTYNFDGTNTHTSISTEAIIEKTVPASREFNHRLNDNDEDKAEVRFLEELNKDCCKEQENDTKKNHFDTLNYTIGLTEGRNSEDRCELEDDVKKQFKKKNRILSAIDSFLSLVLIGPLVIGFWRGIWTLMDTHLYAYPGWYSFIAGIMVHLIFAILRNPVHSYIIREQTMDKFKKILWKITQLLYTYVFGIACNTHWRGGWIMFDEYFTANVWVSTCVTLSMLGVLAIFRSLRNLLAPPVMIFVDNVNYSFWFPTRYKLNTRDWSLYLLDCAFSVGVVGTLVVFVWRGSWILFDIYLFPEDREYSALGSLAIGYGIVTVTFCLQPLMRYVCTRLQGMARLITADGFLLLSFLGTVNVWRGIWNTLDLWLLPENKELSCWITHVGCFVFLVLLNCSNSILVRGVYIDAEEEDGKCVVFPCHYLRLFFKVEREKKEARRRNLLVASKDFRPRTDGNTKDAENGALLPNSTPATIIPANPESLV